MPPSHDIHGARTAGPRRLYSDDEEVKRQSIPSIADAKPAATSVLDTAWIINRAPQEKPFYISDNPVVLHNLVAPRQLRLDTPGIEVYLPISPSLALCFTCRRSVELIRCRTTRVRFKVALILRLRS